MRSPIVFFDIAGPDDMALRQFYTAVLGWDFDETGQFSLPVDSPVKAAIRKDPAEKRLYIGVSDVAATLKTVERSGGSIDSPRFEVPGVVVLGLFRDPAGNPMGLVEMDGAKLRVP